ncbi:outer membrane beta-barrel protein [Corallococcus sp. BB11-1]|uniref:outer membrane beta-barrel protein n=1 Tax=Corallococcus sp. BB11-1 TaxID=2996783 RepID=UPI00226E71F3|nr:outer membrane beta-barrel protein [Corallococcus sp. BB11-1]MCY1031960.1 outer membrane beta-barrel protein [Corallococcus sp. BB11-1]
MTARPFIPSLVMSLSLLAAPALAQEASSGSGLALGVRGAYGIPVGDAAEGMSLSETFGNTVAPQVDLSYFFNRHLSLGGYFQYGIAKPDGCTDTTECSSRVLRFGVDLDYHFAPEGFVSPWLGVGVGYEMGSLKVGNDPTLAKLGLKGFDLGHAHFGVDLQLTRSIAVGPYISASLGQYSDLTAQVFEEPERSIDIPSDQKSLHVWIQPGVRLQIRL